MEISQSGGICGQEWAPTLTIKLSPATSRGVGEERLSVSIISHSVSLRVSLALAIPLCPF